jgi:hypothetical protein
MRKSGGFSFNRENGQSDVMAKKKREEKQTN